MRHSLGIVSRLPAKILNTVSRNCIPVMPFDILISLFPDNPLVIEVLPQYFGYCGRETGFSNCVLHYWGSWAHIHNSPFFQERLPPLDSSAPCSVAWRWGNSKGKVPLNSHPNLMEEVVCLSFSDGGLESLLWKSEFLQVFC